MTRYVDVDALWRDITSNIEDCGDVLEIIERQPTIDHIADDSKKVSSSCGHENGKDVIYRQDAIDAMHQLITFWFGNQKDATKEITRIIKRLPSVQPAYTDEEIQKMQDLEQAQIEKAYQLGYEEGKRDAQPERTGKWTIKNGELAFWDVCSECGRMVIHKAPFYNFCPNCGAMMKDGEEYD